MTRFQLDLSYAQLAVFNSDLPDPFNDWTEYHVAQGFAWRMGSVSFRSMVEAGMHDITVGVVERQGLLDTNAVRAIEVPFKVSDCGSVEVASIGDAVPLTLTPWDYLLRCEFMLPDSNGGGRALLTFSKHDSPRFAIVRSDSELRVEGDLLLTAEPATA